MEQLWELENRRFSPLPKGQKIFWLAKLMFLLTVVARDGDMPGGDSFAGPEKMRKFNEIVHKVVSHQVALIQNEKPQLSDDMLFETVADELQALGVDVDYVAKNLQSFNAARL